MGCGHSTLGRDAAPPVALCRARSALLAQAIDRRFELADAHRAYAASLRASGDALHGFLLAAQYDAAATAAAAAAAQPPPVLPLPANAKGDGAAAQPSLPPPPPPSQLPGVGAAAVAGNVHSAAADGESSGDGTSHIRFPSDGTSATSHIRFPSEDATSSHIHFPSDDASGDEPDPTQLLPETMTETESELESDEDDEPFSFPQPEPLHPGPVAQPLHPLFQPGPPRQPPFQFQPEPHLLPLFHLGPSQQPPFHLQPEPPLHPHFHAGPPLQPLFQLEPQAWWPHQPPQMAAPYVPSHAQPYTYDEHVLVPEPPAYGYGGADMAGYVDQSQSQTYYHVSYARSEPPPYSVPYEHRPPAVTSASFRYYLGDEPTGPPPAGSYYGGDPYSYPEDGGWAPAMAAPAGEHVAPPPTPSPPRVPRWDYLDPFQESESFYQEQPPPAAMAAIHAPGWSPSDDRKEEEGIPELEDECIPELEDEGMPELEDEGIPGLEDESIPAVVNEGIPALVNEGIPEPEAKGMPAQEEEAQIPEPQDKELAVEEEAAEEQCAECNAMDAMKAKAKEEKSSPAGDEEEELQKTPKSSDASTSSGFLTDQVHRKSKSSDTISSIASSAVHVSEKSVKPEEEEEMKHLDVAEPPAEPEKKVYKDDAEVVQELKSQFHRASESAGNVCQALEVGKMPYYQNSGLKVSRMICGQPSMGKEVLQFEEEKAMESGNLSSTLQKLYMWEKKLLHEVEIEEDLRVEYERKCKQLRKLDEKGEEAYKLEATQICIKKLSTKISIAIQAVNTISTKINRLRDEELWPQTCELIVGFMQMWDTMSECHKMQCYALSQAEGIDSVIAGARFAEDHLELLKQLELQLLDSIANFAAWISAQKSFITTLNEWLKKGIEYVPEVTDDGVAPFSPGRLGAPPIFSICNNWAISMGRISEKEVVATMQALASNVLLLWGKHRSDVVRDLKSKEKDERSIRKALAVQHKKLVSISNQSGVSISAIVLYENNPSTDAAGLQPSLETFFEAMETFVTACANTHKDLHSFVEEHKGNLLNRVAEPRS
ncbi:hypothetical protein ACP4OV_017691 [Aristida adscensionis]